MTGCSMIRDFIYKMELFSKKDPRAKKWLLGADLKW